MSFLLNPASLPLDLSREAASLKLLAELYALRDTLGFEGEPLKALNFLLDPESHDAGQRSLLLEAGIDPAELASIAQRIGERFEGHVPEDLARLFAPFSRYVSGEPDAGLIRWRMLDLAGTGNQSTLEGKLHLKFSAGGKAVLEIEAADSELPDAPSLLRFGIRGEASGNAGAEFPFSHGSASAAVQSAAALGAGIWYEVDQHHRHRPIAGLAADRLGDLPSPFDLKSVYRAAQQDRLHALELSTALEVGGDITMSFNIAPSLEPLKLSGSIQFRVSALRAREFILSVAALHESTTRLSINIARRRSRELHNSAAIELGIDPSEVVNQVRAFFDSQVRGGYKTLYEEYREYLTPGTWLRGRFKQLLLDESDLQQLWSTLLDDSARQQQLDSLQEILFEQMDARLAVFTADRKDLARDLADRVMLQLKLRLPTLADDLARGRLEALAESLVGTVQDRLTRQVQERLGAGATELETHLKALQAAGKDFGSQLGDSLETADDALSGVREFLDAIGAKLEAVSNSLKKAAEQRITLRVYNEETRRLRRELSFDFTVSKATPSACKLYEQALTGDFGAIVKKVQQLSSNRGSGYTIQRADLVTFHEEQSRSGTEFGLFALDMGSLSVFNSSVRVHRDLYGNVVLDSSVLSQRRIYALGEAQEVSFLSKMTLWSARKSRFLATSLSVSQEDSDLDSDELTSFLGGFRALGLLSEARIAAALNQLERWESHAPGSKLACNVSVSLALDEEELDALLASAEMPAEEQLAQILDALRRSGARTPDNIRALVNDLRPLVHRKHRREGELMLLQLQASLTRIPGISRDVATDFMSHSFGDTHKRALSLQDSRDARRLLLQVKGFAVLVHTLAELSRTRPRSADRKAIQRRHRLINFCLRYWLRVNARFLWLPSDEVRAETLAFFLLLAQRAGIETPGADSPLMITLKLPNQAVPDGSQDEVLLF